MKIARECVGRLESSSEKKIKLINNLNSTTTYSIHKITVLAFFIVNEFEKSLRQRLIS